ncbi:hypothetical protein E4U43_001492 [Claviceps pusilla]|uniref:Uncharacterized protein n=1 Tax=Claviceps pusilla TaxID=123648 RepID=A0A9P7SZ33_9HYPO|nr:hypothetical protein E4U43_001492 [Claviceps pusilla]
MFPNKSARDFTPLCSWHEEEEEEEAIGPGTLQFRLDKYPPALGLDYDTGATPEVNIIITQPSSHNSPEERAYDLHSPARTSQPAAAILILSHNVKLEIQHQAAQVKQNIKQVIPRSNLENHPNRLLRFLFVVNELIIDYNSNEMRHIGMPKDDWHNYLPPRGASVFSCHPLLPIIVAEDGVLLRPEAHYHALHFLHSQG